MRLLASAAITAHDIADINRSRWNVWVTPGLVQRRIPHEGAFRYWGALPVIVQVDLRARWAMSPSTTSGSAARERSCLGPIL